MDGIHLLGEWYDCPAETPEFTRAEALRGLCLAAVEDAGLTIVGDCFNQFEPQGVTGTVLLAESHLRRATIQRLRGTDGESGRLLTEPLSDDWGFYLRPTRELERSC